MRVLWGGECVMKTDREGNNPPVREKHMIPLRLGPKSPGGGAESGRRDKPGACARLHARTHTRDGNGGAISGCARRNF